MSAPTPSELITYHGNCHCGAVKFTLRIPSLSSTEVGNCNCSICNRNGYLNVYPDPSDFQFTAGLDNLTEYRFGSKVGPHRFCKTCGSSVGGSWTLGGREMMAINARLIQGVHPEDFKLKTVDRKGFGVGYEYPPFPDVPVDDSVNPPLVPYHANCHCGAVTYTVRIPSLTENTVNQCNCSICDTNGYLFVYPPTKDVMFHTGYDSLSEYQFRSRTRAHKFCGTCGSSILIDFAGQGRDEFGMNVRMFKDVDPKTFIYTHYDGRNLLK